MYTNNLCKTILIKDYLFYENGMSADKNIFHKPVANEANLKVLKKNFYRKIHQSQIVYVSEL
jgi:hypothetical protein